MALNAVEEEQFASAVARPEEGQPAVAVARRAGRAALAEERAPKLNAERDAKIIEAEPGRPGAPAPFSQPGARAEAGNAEFGELDWDRAGGRR